MDKTCEFCNKPFKTYDKRKRFCSISCGQKNRHPKNIGDCKFCQKEFIIQTAESGRKLFCSLPCFHKSNTKGKVKIICNNCGKEAYFQPAAAKNRRNCSKKCKYEWLAKLNSKNFKGIEGPDHAGYKNGNTYYKRLGLKNLPNECIVCKNVGDDLWVHHVDGNRKNNVLDNLRILCSGCHKHVHNISTKHGLPLPIALDAKIQIGKSPKNAYRCKEHQELILKYVKLAKSSISSVLVDPKSEIAAD